MLNALLLLSVVTLGGFALTYLYDRESPLLVRLAVGCVTGLTAHALLAFALALRFGLNLTVIVVAALPLLTPLLVFRDRRLRARAAGDIRRLPHLRGRSRHRFAHLLLSLLLLALLLHLFGGVVYAENGGIHTNNHHNYGDLPWHIMLVRGFVVGGNYPPEHLQFAGSRLTYPYLCDFITAEFNACGANLVAAFLITNLALAFCLLALVQQWAFRLTRSPFVMMTTPLLLFFNGGWGWLMLFRDFRESNRPLGQFLLNLPHDYTMAVPDEKNPHSLTEPLYRWGDSLTVLLTTQRSILLGIPLALAALLPLQAALRLRLDDTDETTKAARRHKRRTLLLAAGGITGLLPLSHTHSALVLLTVAACYALPELRRGDRAWRDWLAFFLPACLLMAPQGLMLLSGSDAHTVRFFGIELGWDHGRDHPLVFWLRNTGPFLPLLLAALLLPVFFRRFRSVVPDSVRRFCLPFLLWFLLGNVFRFAPWVWDNIKVLFYGYLAAIPLVLLLLARLWRQRALGKTTCLVLLLLMTLSGGIDVFRVATRQFRQRIYSAEEIAYGEAVDRAVPPRSRILHAPSAGNAVGYAGRRLICGYGGHLWTHGFDHEPRQADVFRIYAGAPDADELLRRYRVEYITVGPPERTQEGMSLNLAYLDRFPVVLSVGEYRLLKVR